MPDELQPVPSSPFSLIELALQKGIDPERLGKLYDLYERHEVKQAAEVWGEAIKKFQRLCQPIAKTAMIPDKQGNPKYYFADYEDIMAVAQPILDQCGIVLTFDTEAAGAMMKTTCRVRVGTHMEATSVVLPHPQIPNANATQMAGGALTYGQRYALKAALNIRIKGEDTDGHFQEEGLSPEQTKVLNEMFDDCGEAVFPGGDRQRFWDFIFHEDKTEKRMPEMSAKDFPRAVDKLNSKRRAKK